MLVVSAHRPATLRPDSNPYQVSNLPDQKACLLVELLRVSQQVTLHHVRNGELEKRLRNLCLCNHHAVVPRTGMDGNRCTLPWKSTVRFAMIHGITTSQGLLFL